MDEKYEKFAQRTYGEIFHENSPNYFSNDLGYLKRLILRNRDILSENDRLLFMYELADIIKREKINEARNQKMKYKQILMANYDGIQSLYDWIKEQTDYEITPAPESKIDKKNIKLKLDIKDIKKFTDVYDFCIETKVISEYISNLDFINATNNADFSQIYTNAEQENSKTKFKYIIYVLSFIIDNPEWYLLAAQNINTEPNKCSGANVPTVWKKQADALK